MYELKNIRIESVPRAITKAERYRLLNEPRSAESICRDVLAVDPQHIDALKILVLAITDQFPNLDARKGMRERKEEVETLLLRLPDEYSRHYYSGVMLERWAKGLLGAGYSPTTVLEFFERAMREYDAAAVLAGADNQDAVLRWNTCVRIILRNSLVATEEAAGYDLDSFSDEVPGR